MSESNTSGATKSGSTKQNVVTAILVTALGAAASVVGANLEVDTKVTIGDWEFTMTKEKMKMPKYGRRKVGPNEDARTDGAPA